MRGRKYVPLEERRNLSQNKKEWWKRHGLPLGERNPFFGKKHSEQTKEIIRQKALGHKVSEIVRKKIAKRMKSRVFLEQTKQLLSQSKKLYWMSNRDRMRGEKNPMALATNREKVARKKKKYWTEHCNEIVGERNPNWNGGKSFEPYSPEFTEVLKRSVRQRDRYQCRRCGADEDGLGYALSIHHINYNKKDNQPENLTSLCKACHSKTNFDRMIWKRLFQPAGRILVDWEIDEYSKKFGMIQPFVSKQIRQDVVSWGLSAMGYDIRVADEFKIFTDINTSIVDPKNFNPKSLVDFKGEVCIIPPNSFALARTVEYFRIPRKIIGVCIGKSTYARCGIVVNITPLEPEWEGYLTIEISNTTPLPAKIYANEGIAQVLFLESDEICEVSYADKKGKYQKQREITLPKLQ